MIELPQYMKNKALTAGFTDDPKIFLGEDYNSKDYEKLNDIVEVWFDSGSTHSFVLEKERFEMACRYVFRGV